MLHVTYIFIESHLVDKTSTSMKGNSLQKHPLQPYCSLPSWIFTCLRIRYRLINEWDVIGKGKVIWWKLVTRGSGTGNKVSEPSRFGSISVWSSKWQQNCYQHSSHLLNSTAFHIFSTTRYWFFPTLFSQVTFYIKCTVSLNATRLFYSKLF